MGFSLYLKFTERYMPELTTNVRFIYYSTFKGNEEKIHKVISTNDPIEIARLIERTCSAIDYIIRICMNYREDLDRLSVRIMVNKRFSWYPIDNAKSRIFIMPCYPEEFEEKLVHNEASCKLLKLLDEAPVVQINRSRTIEEIFATDPYYQHTRTPVMKQQGIKDESVSDSDEIVYKTRKGQIKNRPTIIYTKAKGGE